MSNPVAVWKLGRDVYAFIKDNPMVSRADLNIAFRTSSDQKKNDLLTEALLCMLTLGQVKKHLEPATTAVYFWTSGYTPQTVQADTIVNKHPHPVDVLGQMPKDRVPAPTPAPTPAPVQEQPFRSEPDENDRSEDPDDKAEDRFEESLNGMLKEAFKVMRTDPFRLWKTTDAEFINIHANPVVRAQAVGRLAGLGAVKKYKADIGGATAFTLRAGCPAGYSLAVFDLSSKAKARKANAEDSAHRQEQINTIKADLQQRGFTGTLPLRPPAPDIEEEEVEHDPDAHSPEPDEADDLELQESPDQEADEYHPHASISSLQLFRFVRANGETLDFDEEESAAWRDLIRMINIDNLR